MYLKEIILSKYKKGGNKMKTFKRVAKAVSSVAVKASANSVSTIAFYQPKKPDGLAKFSKIAK